MTGKTAAMSWFLKLPEDLIALILREWLFPAKISPVDAFTPLVRADQSGHISPPKDCRSQFPFAHEQLFDIVQLDIACCSRIARSVLLSTFRMCSFNGTVDLSQFPSVSGIFSWFIDRRIPLRSIYGVKIILLESFAESWIAKPMEVSALQSFLENIAEVHHIVIKYQNQLQAEDQLIFMLRSLPNTHISAQFKDMAHRPLFFFPNVTLWTLADPTELLQLHVLQNFTSIFSPYLHNHVLPMIPPQSTHFPVLFFSSLMSSQRSDSLQALDVLQSPSSLAKTAAAAVVTRLSELRFLRFINSCWPDKNILRVLHCPSMDSSLSIFPHLISLKLHQIISPDLAEDEMLYFGENWHLCWSHFQANKETALLNSRVKLEHLHLHQSSLSASRTQMASDLAALLMLEHASSLKSLALLDCSISHNALTALFLQLRSPSSSTAAAVSNADVDAPASLLPPLLPQFEQLEELVIARDFGRFFSLNAHVGTPIAYDETVCAPSMALRNVTIESMNLRLLLQLVFHEFWSSHQLANTSRESGIGSSDGCRYDFSRSWNTRWKLQHLYLVDGDFHARSHRVEFLHPLHTCVPLVQLHSLRLEYVSLSNEAVRWILLEHANHMPLLRSLYWTQFTNQLEHLLLDYNRNLLHQADAADEGYDRIDVDVNGQETDPIGRRRRRQRSRLQRLVLAPSPRHVLSTEATSALLHFLTTESRDTLTHVALWSCRMLYAKHVPPLIQQWRRLRYLSIELIGDIAHETAADAVAETVTATAATKNAAAAPDTARIVVSDTSDHDTRITTEQYVQAKEEATDERQSEAGRDHFQDCNRDQAGETEREELGSRGEGGVVELELNNCAELTVAGLRRLLFHPDDSSSSFPATELNSSRRKLKKWPALHILRCSAASLRPNPFLFHQDHSNTKDNGNVSATRAAKSTIVKKQLAELARELIRFDVRVYDGYRFVED